MSMHLTLHYAPDNASLCVRIALEELQLPYRALLVDRASQAQRSPAFLAMNPNGLIPVLETPQGPLFETGAILIWLADTHGALLPHVNAPDRAHALQWLIWLANTLHPALRMLFYPDLYTEGDPEQLRAGIRKRLTAHLDVLENAANTDWLAASAPTMQGCYLGPLLRWPKLYGGSTDWYDLARWPRLLRFAQIYENRAAVQRAASAEGLGPTPFSAPVPCQPTQGSAT